VPDVEFVGIRHPGLIGCAPSHDLLSRWNRREQALIDTNPDRVPPLALPPLPDNALLGTLSGSEVEQAAGEACRTIPPHEYGGNVDIKDLTVGSRIYFPVYVDGAKLSVGDLHFSQGDGEITFCGAIEMAGYIGPRRRADQGGHGEVRHEPSHPHAKVPAEPPPAPLRQLPPSSRVSGSAKTTLTLSGSHRPYRQACLNAIDY